MTLYSQPDIAQDADATPALFNDRFDAIANILNGHVDGTNIADGSITTSKIADGAVTLAKLDTTTQGNVQGGWYPMSQTFAYGANNGNKEFTITTQVDLTGTLYPGMRLKIPRSVTPPTQCMSYASASSQYASRAAGSVAGITFTNTFTLEAWIYINDYVNGAAMTIICRRDTGTANGFQLRIEGGDGRLAVFGLNAGGYRSWTTLQSVPLKKWTHVACSVTMSTTTANLYINGTLAPSTLVSSGTPTAIVQAGPLAVGGNAVNPNEYFNGYIAGARIWSVAQSQASIQANMAFSLAGTETNLVGLWKGDGNFNDSTTNANTLTASGGAVATQLFTGVGAAPYNATEYGIITKVAYANPTTTITLFTGTDYSVPNQTLGTVSYSLMKDPYGFPTNKEKWRVTVPIIAQKTTSIGSIASWIASGFYIACPIGSWVLGYSMVVDFNSTVSGSRHFHGLLADGTVLPFVNGLYTKPLTTKGFVAGAQDGIGTLVASFPIFNPTSGTQFEFKGSIVSATGSEIYYIAHGNTYSELYAECAHL